jgi:hypothetical protein
MLRLLARFVGIWLIAAALVAAVIDGAKSIAASALVVTPVAETWASLAAFAGSPPSEGVETNAPWPLDMALGWLLAMPTVLVLVLLGALLLFAGAKRRSSFISREYMA